MMLQLQECFSEVKELELSFLFDHFLVNRPSDPTKLGLHLAKGLNQFRSLTRLYLAFNSGKTAEIFGNIAATVFLPQLKNLQLHLLLCYCDALSAFIRRHATMLESCTLLYLSFPELDAGQQAANRFSEVLEVLRNCLLLELLVIGRLAGFECHISFPREYAHVDWSEEPNEDGYIEIQVDTSLLVLKDDEVDQGIAQIIDRITCNEDD